MAKTRTFIGVDVSGDVRQRAGQLVESLRPRAADVKWVAPANLHWTLQFLGDVDDLQIPAVCDAIAAAVVDFAPFLLEAQGAGAFPTIDRPRTLWLGAGRGQEEMCRLQAAVEASLADLGFRSEARRYVPHLTLGRAGRGRNLAALAGALRENAQFDAGATLVDEVIVYASELERGGPTYHVLGRAALEGADS